MEPLLDAMWRFPIAIRQKARYTALMAHTKPSDLADLTALRAELAKLPGVSEKKPGIFYRKGEGLLHFHDKDGVRWADVKLNAWSKVDLDFGASEAKKKKLVSIARGACEANCFA
jgi:hypothetical protein